MSTPEPRHQQVLHLDRPDGRVAYTVEGSGPLVVAVPGMGDLRSTWDDVAPALAAAGHRVAVVDLRGHGDSGTTFTRHGDIATAQDVLALVEHLDGGPAVVMGSSMGASAAAWAATERPDLVAGLVLFGPLLREPQQSAAVRAVMHGVYRVLFARPWGAAAWSSMYRRYFARGVRSARHDQHADAIRASMSDPARLRSFRDLTLQLDHRPVEERLARLAELGTPAVAVIGDVDPDFRDPAAELTWIAETTGARTVAVPGVGHYPQHQQPEAVVDAALELLAGLPRTADAWAAARA